MSAGGFLYVVGQAVTHRMTREEANVVARDEHWYRGRAYRLRFAGDTYSNMVWYTEGDLELARPPMEGGAWVEDMTEFNMGTIHG